SYVYSGWNTTAETGNRQLMEVKFDHIAEKYDREFTYSQIGLRQRRSVWNYLDRLLPDDRALDILELNCGTGEDAVYFAKQGHSVIATDVSEMMVKATQQKAKRKGVSNRIQTMRLAMEDISEFHFDRKFDIIFSDFGGLNCVEPVEFQRMSQVFARLLRPGGHFVGVVMPHVCLWESWYFMVRFRFKRMFRRATNKEVAVNIEGKMVETWYYSPSRIKNYFGKDFDYKAKRPIGFFIPPSYLERFFIKRLKWLTLLEKLERVVSWMPWLAALSDHFLIDLQNRK
ncbi:MAG: class I SAM-dependent methyltransferase, partial [Bacteroidota bacterium]